MTRTTPPTIDPTVLRYLAEQAATWPVLHAYHHEGLATARQVLGERGGAGHGNDGVFRAWFTEPRGHIRVQVGGTRAPIQRVRLAEVLAWADRQLAATDWARMEQLLAQRLRARHQLDRLQEAAARTGADPTWPASPIQFTAAEHIQARELGAATTAAERELARLLLDTYTTDRGGEQLGLFSDPTTALRPSAGDRPILDADAGGRPR